MGKRRAKHRKDKGLPIPADTRSGRIIGRKGPVYFVADENDDQVSCLARGAAKRAVIGDLIHFVPEIENDMADGLIVKVTPRRSELFRTDALGRRPQTIAANVDKICVVAAAVPEMREGLIDRYLVAAHAQEIETVLVFNKTDLLTPEERTSTQSRLMVYSEIGIPVLETSIHMPETLAPLYAALKAHTSIFVGHSGVGKTSLINAICPDVSEKVQAVSEATGRGQHTTTTSWSYPLAMNGDIIDSPGIRSFGLWGIAPDDLRNHFVEFLPLADACRFGNCQHIKEPKCAVRDAVAAGSVAQSRYDSYLRMRESLEDERY